MAARHVDAHLAQVGNLLPLEAVEVGLDRRARVLEILRGQMQRVLELLPRQHTNEDNNTALTCEMFSRVLLIPLRRAASGSASIMPCSV
jgi:hypothetical protein